MAEQPLRVGIASFAHSRASAYARALSAIGGATLAGIWDDDAGRGLAAAAEFSARSYERLDQLLADVDALVVTSESARHRDLALAAAGARVHVLCEKPLATTAADARAMIAACEQAGVLLGTAFTLRYSDAVRQLRAAVRGGTLGETLMIRATSQGAYPGGWTGDPRLAGGGALMDQAGDVADLLGWIWGRELSQVYAETATRHHDLPVEDAAMLLITLEGGLTASLDPSWSRPVAAWPGSGCLTIEATGTAGVASVDAFAQSLEVFSNARVRAEWRRWGDDLARLMLEDWLRAVRAGGPAPIDGEDGLRALELVLAAYRSAERHEPVAVGKL